MAWVFSHSSTAPYFYEAFTDCELWCVPREDFIAFLKNNANSQFLLFDFFVKRYLLSMQMKMLSLEQAKATDKILYLLKFLTMRFGGDKTAGMVDIDLPLTQQDIASSAGITRETEASSRCPTSRGSRPPGRRDPIPTSGGSAGSRGCPGSSR